ncbi:MAG: hypothetical protein MZV64_09490 [Ignavibacteriales bacterium]|nr:hypothetical protein [Ignavibacteriales bacterium]
MSCPARRNPTSSSWTSCSTGEMDGIEAARIIRKQLGHPDHLPHRLLRREDPGAGQGRRALRLHPQAPQGAGTLHHHRHRPVQERDREEAAQAGAAVLGHPPLHQRRNRGHGHEPEHPVHEHRGGGHHRVQGGCRQGSEPDPRS